MTRKEPDVQLGQDLARKLCQDIKRLVEDASETAYCVGASTPALVAYISTEGAAVLHGIAAMCFNMADGDRDVVDKVRLADHVKWAGLVAMHSMLRNMIEDRETRGAYKVIDRADADFLKLFGHNHLRDGASCAH